MGGHEMKPAHGGDRKPAETTAQHISLQDSTRSPDKGTAKPTREKFDDLLPLVERLNRSHHWMKTPDGPVCIREKFDDFKIAEHVAGRRAYGLCPIAPGESTCRAAVLDFDSHDGETEFPEMLDTAQNVAFVLEQEGYAPILFRSSGGRGLHLWLVWDEAQDAYSVREMLAEAIGKLGFKPGTAGVAAKAIEIFPKQNEVAPDGAGSMVVLPWAGKSEPIGEFNGWPASPSVPVLPRPPKPERVVTVTPETAVLRSALAAIPNTGADAQPYDIWRNVCFAVHHATGGSDEGLELFREWSARSSKHDDEFLDSRVWCYAGVTSGEVITERSLYALAAQHGWTDPTIIDDFDVVETPVGEATDKPLHEEYTLDLTRLKPVEYTVDGFLPNGLTVIAGAPGVGKTSMLAPLAATVAALFESSMAVALRRKVVYVCEAPEQVERILYGLHRHAPGARPAGEFMEWFKVIPARRHPHKRLGGLIRAWVKKHTVLFNGYPVAPLIVLDTSNATMDMESENDNAEAGRAIAAIKENLATGACWLVAHTPKALKRADADDLTARGAGAFEGDANATAVVFQEDDIPGKRFMATRKRRFEAEFTELEFSTEEHQATVPTPWGTEQSTTYRIGLPQPSHQGARLAAKETAKAARDEQHMSRRMNEIKALIVGYLEMSRADEGKSKNAIEKAVRRQAQDVRTCIAHMVEEGELVVVGSGRGGSALYALPPEPALVDPDLEDAQ